MSKFGYNPPTIAGNVIDGLEFAQQTEVGINDVIKDIGVSKWASNRKYNVNDFVSYGAEIYRSTVSNNLSNNPSISSVWSVYSHTLTNHLYIYVSPDGSDKNNGSVNAPFATAGKAVSYLDKINFVGTTYT